MHLTRGDGHSPLHINHSNFLEFESSQSRPDLGWPTSVSPDTLCPPSLTDLRFKGVVEYLGVIVASIDVPRLNSLCITFFHRSHIHTPELVQLITRTPRLKAPDRVSVLFRHGVEAKLPSRTSGYGNVNLMPRVGFTAFVHDAGLCLGLSLYATMENLYVRGHRNSRPGWNGGTGNAPWLELLRTFSSVKNLYVSGDIVHMPYKSSLVAG